MILPVDWRCSDASLKFVEVSSVSHVEAGVVVDALLLGLLGYLGCLI